jgi:hypothetical protein
MIRNHLRSQHTVVRHAEPLPVIISRFADRRSASRKGPNDWSEHRPPIRRVFHRATAIEETPVRVSARRGEAGSIQDLAGDDRHENASLDCSNNRGRHKAQSHDGHEQRHPWTPRPVDRFVVEPELRYASLQDTRADTSFLAGYVGRVKTSLQVTRELSLRLLTQYDHFGGSVAADPLVVDLQS